MLGEQTEKTLQLSATSKLDKSPNIIDKYSKWTSTLKTIVADVLLFESRFLTGKHV